MYNKEIFKPYFDKIEDKHVKEIVNECLDNAPDYFWDMPASTTGKYHPEYALGEGGLVRHTLSVCYYADSLLSLEMFKSLQESKDYILAACILHDVMKKGKNAKKFTAFEHPEDAAEFVENVGNELKSCDIAYGPKSKVIASLIRTHMGQWNTAKYSSVTLQKPSTNEQKFVHLCDYIASRKGDEDVLSFLNNK